MNTILLAYGKNIIDQPVEYETRGKIDKHERKDYWQKHHDLCLSRISGSWGHLLLNKHGGAHQQGKDGNPIRGRHKWNVKREVEQTVGR